MPEDARLLSGTDEQTGLSGAPQAMLMRQGPTARTLIALAWYMKVLPKRSRKDSRRWPRL